jgi:hypothetical protein
MSTVSAHRCPILPKWDEARESEGRLRHYHHRCYNADKTRWPTTLVPPPF